MLTPEQDARLRNLRDQLHLTRLQYETTTLCLNQLIQQIQHLVPTIGAWTTIFEEYDGLLEQSNWLTMRMHLIQAEISAILDSQ